MPTQAPPPLDPHAGLAALEQRLAQDMLYLGLPPRAWVPPRQTEGQPVLDVVVIGGGQAGLAAAIGLAQQGIGDQFLGGNQADLSQPGIRGEVDFIAVERPLKEDIIYLFLFFVVLVLIVPIVFFIASPAENHEAVLIRKPSKNVCRVLKEKFANGWHAHRWG